MQLKLREYGYQKSSEHIGFSMKKSSLHIVFIMAKLDASNFLRYGFFQKKNGMIMITVLWLNNKKKMKTPLSAQYIIIEWYCIGMELALKMKTPLSAKYIIIEWYYIGMELVWHKLSSGILSLL